MSWTAVPPTSRRPVWSAWPCSPRPPPRPAGPPRPPVPLLPEARPALDPRASPGSPRVRPAPRPSLLSSPDLNAPETTRAGPGPASDVLCRCRFCLTTRRPEQCCEQSRSCSASRTDLLLGERFRGEHRARPFSPERVKADVAGGAAPGSPKAPASRSLLPGAGAWPRTDGFLAVCATSRLPRFSTRIRRVPGVRFSPSVLRTQVLALPPPPRVRLPEASVASATWSACRPAPRQRQWAVRLRVEAPRETGPWGAACSPWRPRLRSPREHPAGVPGAPALTRGVVREAGLKPRFLPDQAPRGLWAPCAPERPTPSSPGSAGS